MKLSDELLIVSSAFRYRETTLWLKQLIYLKDFNCRNIFLLEKKETETRSGLEHGISEFWSDVLTTAIGAEDSLEGIIMHCSISGWIPLLALICMGITNRVQYSEQWCICHQFTLSLHPYTLLKTGCTYGPLMRFNQTPCSKGVSFKHFVVFYIHSTL